MIIGKHRVYVLAAAFLWGCIGVFFKELSARGFEPIQIVLIRASVALLGLGLWLLITDKKAFRIRLKDIWCFFGTGVVSLLMLNWFFFRAIEEVGLAIAGVLLYTAPAIVTVLSVLLFKEKLKRSGWGILVMIIFGCALVSGVIGSVYGISISGILFGLGSGFGYALYSIFSRYALLRGYSPQTISFYTFLFCVLACTPFVLNTTINPDLQINDPSIWLYSLALGFLGCLLPYWLYTKGLSGLTGAAASMTATLEPIVAVLFGVILYNEVLAIWQIVGIVLVLGGIILLAKTSSVDEDSEEADSIRQE